MAQIHYAIGCAAAHCLAASCFWAHEEGIAAKLHVGIESGACGFVQDFHQELQYVGNVELYEQHVGH